MGSRSKISFCNSSGRVKSVGGAMIIAIDREQWSPPVQKDSQTFFYALEYLRDSREGARCGGR